LKIEEYIDSLPQEIISGEQVSLPDKSLRDIFNFVGLGKDDVFYHLGCDNANGISIAVNEYNVKKAIGIDIDPKKIEQSNKDLTLTNAKLVCGDIYDLEFSDATVILFWFTDENIIDKMMDKFKNLPKGCKVVTIWSPLPNCIPQYVDFPYMINQTPFSYAKTLQDQLLAVFDVKCIDFVTAWEHAERYTKAIGSVDAKNDRFLTILQSLTIWINAKNLGIACGDDMPESIKTYIGILKTFFNIEVEHLLEK
jgi:trans-aconitate methyltransferase